MQVTLDPKNDDAATTVLYLYAALTKDVYLEAWLRKNGKFGRFDSLTVDAENPVGALSMPGGTVEDVKETLGKLGFRPVRLVCVNESGWEDVA